MVYVHCSYHAIVCFEGMEKSETKEGWELPKSDVLLGASLPDVHEAEDAKYRSGNRGKSKWTTPGSVKIPKWNKGFTWLSDF